MGERNRSDTAALTPSDVSLRVLTPVCTVQHSLGLMSLIRSTRLAFIASFFALCSGTFISYVGTASAQTGDKAAIVKKDSQEKPASAIPWKKIPAAEKKILSPLETEWPKLPAQQQRKLMGAAKEYPKLSPLEQDRFKERLRSWSALTPEQRNHAREKYKSLNSLPPEKQKELKARWQQEKKTDEVVSPTPSSTAVVPKPAPSK